MKFITETDLRDLYKIQPFTDYDLQEGERLTPGARQFLLDRGVDLYDRNDPYADIGTGTSVVGSSTGPKTAEKAKPLGDRKKRLFCAKFDVLKADFLLAAKEMLELDVCASQQLTGLYRQFAQLSQVAEGKCDVPDLNCSACTGITVENLSCCIGPCFEVTEFHMQMPKGKEMLILAKLRSEIDAFDVEAEELISDANLQQQFTAKLNQIINSIAQMICAAMGGSECQRQA